MKVALFGATGFVGSYLLDELVARQHEPVALVRPGSESRLRHAESCRIVSGNIGDADAVVRAIDGCDAAIYNIGILREYPSRGITYHALHFEGAKRAVDAAREAGCRRFVLMSANGVKADGTAYQRTKLAAEHYLRQTDLAWTVFRPSVLFGDPRGRMEFATQLYRDIIRSPLPAPLFFDGLSLDRAGRFRLAPIHVRDVASIFVAALNRDETIGRVYSLCGPDAFEWGSILQTLARTGGKSKLALPAPAAVIKLAASALDGFEFFPITREQLTMLLEGNVCDDPGAVFAEFGVTPTPFTTENLSYLVS